MNEHQNNQPLKQALGEWKLESSLSRDFQRKVWERIASIESRRANNPFIFLKTWIEQSLIRPTVAASYVAVLLLFGLAGGYARTQVRDEKIAHAERQAYVQMVDPYQMPRP